MPPQRASAALAHTSMGGQALVPAVEGDTLGDYE